MPTQFAGRFTLVDPVGAGMSGTVWRAFDHRLGGYCAAKLVRPADAGLLLRVVREQGFRLEHPHVSSPYAWVADGDVLIAMELFAGGSLASLIRDYGALPESYTAAILGQLLDALDHVHSVGLVHRDVKPANVLLEVTGQDVPRCLLGDFGLALPREGPRLTEAGYVVGTWGYLPPEASTGAPPDVRRDLYALGVLAWQLLSGSEDAPEEPPTIPAGAGPLWDLVGALAEAEPRARPEDAAQALARLREIAPGLGPVTPASTADGEPIEVFDVLGPLPEDTPEGQVLRGIPRNSATRPDGRGPVPRASSSAVRVAGSSPMPLAPPATAPPVATPPPSPTSTPTPPTPTPPTSTPTTPTPPTPTPTPPPTAAPSSGAGSPSSAPSVSLWLRAARQDAVDTAPELRAPVVPAGSRPAVRRLAHPGRWAVLGSAVVVAAVTTALIATGGDEADPAAPTSTPPVAPAGSTGAGPTPGGVSPTPAASRVVTSPVSKEVVSGAACDWYDVAAEARMPGGTRMRCTYQDNGMYRWIPISAP
ncbi:serine/threonine-protein kinase [Embleya sp. NBC_00896]|uniref:serine/threonine-protein kinase n=1 Tax=Embleya sp. NBC_00896 TaxID=2975961 RepID=UPI00386DD851|nr:serine/threonine protein kinase [Embleya sp. NBC_00896]